MHTNCIEAVQELGTPTVQLYNKSPVVIAAHWIFTYYRAWLVSPLSPCSKGTNNRSSMLDLLHQSPGLLTAEDMVAASW
jgi:hypothetical protein